MNGMSKNAPRVSSNMGFHAPTIRLKGTIFGGRKGPGKQATCGAMMRQLLCILCCFAGLSVSLPTAFAALSSPSSPPSRSAETAPPLFAFAQSLFEAGEFYRAIGEFQRFLFFQPEH